MYQKEIIGINKWVIYEAGHEWRYPALACTFAFDTETLTYLDNKVVDTKQLFKKLKNCNNEEKRKRLKNVVWSWQAYDEVNGFFMTNDFDTWLDYQAQAGYKFGWCFNATFDFAQIDYQVLSNSKWKPFIKPKGKRITKAIPWTYSSIHNDMGARYSYKLWIEYRNRNRHVYTHAVEYRDFNKIVVGSLRNLLIDFDVKDNEGNAIRKLEMDYQAVNPDDLSQEEIDYCCNDVKGLYFAIKQMNQVIEEQSNDELHIFGNDTNLMTAGGFAKHELLRSIYPQLDSKKKRIKAYQKEHPITEAQDKFFRDNHLYRGGICTINKRYKGLLLTAKDFGCKMNRYDVNSEYPYSMANINDLVGRPMKWTPDEWCSCKNKQDYQAIYFFESIHGQLKQGMIAMFYDPKQKEYVDVINYNDTYLMYKEEFDELCNWYDLEVSIKCVIVYKRGEKIYAPYILKNYEMKRQAKKDKNKVLEKTSKLNLNSSYGKLAERIERIIGSYVINEETGAVHFIRTGEENSKGSSLNVAVGALVTSFARTYIMSKIREVCGLDKDGVPLVSRLFVYIDTDSIHAFASYEKADAYSLGGLKLEAECEAVKYIAPKTYIDIEKVSKYKRVDINDIEVHTKGVNTSAVVLDLKNKKRLTLGVIDKQIKYGSKYKVLQAMNVIGGKVLIPVEKYLARLELASNENVAINNGYINEI